MNELGARLAEVQQRIADAARRSGRTPQEVRLIAASKRQPVEAIRELAALGVKDFAESQMQEALEKIPRIRPADLQWHFIGHLQSNKTRHVPDCFDWVHSIDSLKLARRVSSATGDSGRCVNLLLQVNVANDPDKHGVSPDKLPPLVDAILAAELKNISLRGLMTIGFRDAGETETRRGFATLRKLRDEMHRRFGGGFTELSMGMSGDYVAAIQEGATMVRVGSALFGSRV